MVESFDNLIFSEVQTHQTFLNALNSSKTKKKYVWNSMCL